MPVCMCVCLVQPVTKLHRRCQRSQHWGDANVHLNPYAGAYVYCVDSVRVCTVRICSACVHSPLQQAAHSPVLCVSVGAASATLYARVVDWCECRGAAAVASCPQLDLSRSGMTNSCVFALAKSLAFNRSVTELDLRGNSIRWVPWCSDALAAAGGGACGAHRATVPISSNGRSRLGRVGRGCSVWFPLLVQFGGWARWRWRGAGSRCVRARLW